MGPVTDWIVALMDSLGSPGAGLLVALESIFPPIPSELISIPAGEGRMPVVRFALLTAAGSLVWNSLLIAAGYTLGLRWEVVQTWVGRFQVVVVVLPVLALLVVVVRRVRATRNDRREAGRLVP